MTRESIVCGELQNTAELIGAGFVRRRRTSSRRATTPWRGMESIEARAFLSASALGPEVQINPVSILSQNAPAIAVAANGDFVVAYSDTTGNNDGTRQIIARQYNADGTPKGDTILVNATHNAGSTPSIAVDDAGDFVVAWTGSGGVPNVFASVFSAQGVRTVDEFQVNTANGVAPGFFAVPGLAMDGDGDFVIGWVIDDAYVGNIVRFQRFNSGGERVGVNETATDTLPETQIRSVPTVSIAMDQDGDFVMGWAEERRVGNYDYSKFLSDSAVLKRYNAAGIQQGNAITAYTITKPNRGSVADVEVAMDDAGDFAVAYEFNKPPKPSQPDLIVGAEVWTRRYSALGVPAAATRAVSTPAEVTGIALDMSKAGEVTVAWATHSYYDIPGTALMAQRYTAASKPDGPAFVINGTASGPLGAPSVAVADSGNRIFGFEAGGSGLDTDVFFRRFQPTSANFGDFGNLGATNAKLVIQDADGTTVTYALTGKGYATVDPQGNVKVLGTDAKSTVTITGKGGNGFVTLGNTIVAASLKSFTAKTSNLTGSFAVGGTLGSLALRNAGVVGELRALQIGDGEDKNTPIVISFLDVTDFTIASNVPIKSLTANSWNDTNASTSGDVISADYIGTLSTKLGFNASLALTGTSLPKPTSNTLTKVTIGGGANSALWSVTGNVGSVTIKGIASIALHASGNIASVTAGELLNARVFAGVDPVLIAFPLGLVDFVNSSTLGSLTVTGVAGQSKAFINSLVAAKNINKITLKQVDFGEGAPGTIGVAADQIKSYKRDATTLKNLDAPGDQDVNGNYVVNIV